MIRLSVAELARIAGGRAHGFADPEGTYVDGPAVRDSREAGPGALFFALVGERVDGHDFADQVRAAGAVVVGTRDTGGPAVVVDDALVAMSRLARAQVDRLPDLTVIGLTGSSGKTSTKDLLAAVLETHADTVATAASLNNEIGLPLTALAADTSTRFLVLEMGARGVGHIASLCETAPPTVGLVLNVGAAHAAGFGGKEMTARAKSELVQALPAGGVAVLNADDPLVASMAEVTRARVVLFGTAAHADVRAEGVTFDDAARASFRLVTPRGAAEVSLRLYGGHHVSNALAAAAVAVELGMPVEQVATALSTAQPRSRWRMEVTQRPDGLTVVNDAYNANPESVRAALEALAAMARGRRTWAVLGEMAELGDTSVAEHAAVGRLVEELGVARLVVVGERARPILHPRPEHTEREGSVFVPDADGALALLRQEVRPQDVVLVKASRVVGLERVAAGLLEESVA